MSPLKLFLLFFFLEAAFILVGTTVLSGWYATRLALLPGFWIIIAFFNLLGLLIGWIIYEMNLKPVARRIRLYTIGFSVSFLLFAGFITAIVVDSFDQNPESNSEYNHRFLKTADPCAGKAFYTLKSNFDDPDILRLDGFLVQKTDTSIAGTRDTLCKVFFTYTLGVEHNKRLSKHIIWAGLTTTYGFNSNPDTDREYQEITNGMKKDIHDALDTLRNGVDQLPDSTRQRVKEVLREVPE